MRGPLSMMLPAALALALAGCERAAAPATAPAAEPEPQAVDTLAPDQLPPEESEPGRTAAAPAAPAARPAIAGDYAAISRTAMAITGDASFAGSQVGFANGLSYRTAPERLARASDGYGGGTWSELFAVAPDALVEIRRVSEAVEPDGLANGGLCGATPTAWLALHAIDDEVHLAAFSGETPPGPEAAETALCGTFLYARG